MERLKPLSRAKDMLSLRCSTSLEPPRLESTVHIPQQVLVLGLVLGVLLVVVVLVLVLVLLLPLLMLMLLLLMAAVVQAAAAVRAEALPHPRRTERLWQM